ncbi:hypothetical protein EDC01DRAFT_636699 [Geopyxis carbonaria]|nr:hypothetical protein EDC01DRAFT_636699 [Geopyxis carbonaria]
MIRSTLRPQTFRPVLRKQIVAPRQTLRFNSTAMPKKAEDASPLLAGAVGGLVTLVGGYAWYHISGTKKVVQTARSTIESFESAKNKVTANTPSTAEAASFIRSTTQHYLSSIPGAGPAVDRAFHTLDSLSEHHGDDVNRIISETYEELRETISNGGLDKKTGEKVAAIMEKRIAELGELGKDAGQRILSENPELRKTLGSSFETMRELGQRYGPEAQRVVEETYKEVQDIIDSGDMTKAAKLVRDKTQKVQELGRRSGNSAWEAMVEEVDGYLNKVPRVKEVFGDQAGELRKLVLQGGIGASVLPKVIDRVRHIADSEEGENRERVEQFRDMLEDVINQGRKKLGGRGSGSNKSSSFGGSGSTMESMFSEVFLSGDGKNVEQYIRIIPGGEYALQQMPVLKAFVELSQHKGDEVQSLLKETMEEMNQVMDKRMKQAQKMLDEEKKKQE